LAAVGTGVLVGARADDTAAADAGTVYLFDGDPTSTTFGSLKKTLTRPGGTTGKDFGVSLAVLGNSVLVGSDAAHNTGASNSGTVFRYDVDPSSPTYGTLLSTLKKTTPVTGDQFGAAVAVAGDDVIVGAPVATSSAGEVYRFTAASFVSFSAASINENG